MFDFNDVMSVLTHIRGGIPVLSLSSRIRLGQHKSMFFGQSYDFYDVQEYDPERDLPNQIIRSAIGPDEDMVYSRKCVEEHEAKVIFMVDVSSSIDTGKGFVKRRLLLESIGYIGLTAVRHQDPVGLMCFADKVVLNQPAKYGQNNFYHILKQLYDFLKEGKENTPRETDFFAGLDFIKRSFSKPCLIVLVSDFIGFEPALSSSLLRTVAAKHELILVFLDDLLEVLSSRGLGYLRLKNIETGRYTIVSRRKMIRLEKELRLKRKELRRGLRSMGIDSVVLDYGNHFSRLHRFFTKRRKIRNPNTR